MSLSTRGGEDSSEFRTYACPLSGETSIISYAVLRLDAKSVTRLLSLIESAVRLHRDLPGFYRVELFDYDTDAEFYVTLPDELDHVPDSEQRFVQIRNDAELDQPEGIGLLCVSVKEDGVHWSAVPKHCTAEAETPHFGCDQLHQLLRELQHGNPPATLV